MTCSDGQTIQCSIEDRRRRPGGNDPRREERKHRNGRPLGRHSRPASDGGLPCAGHMSGLRPDAPLEMKESSREPE